MAANVNPDDQELQQHTNTIHRGHYDFFPLQVKEASTSQLHDHEKTVTNSGRASKLDDILRRNQRKFIVEGTPITYLPRDLLLLIHEHLLVYQLLQTASVLLKEAQLELFPSVVAPSSLVQQPSTQETSPITSATIDAATPTPTRLEKAVIAAASPLRYSPSPSDILLLIYKHLEESGLSQTASVMLEEARSKPLLDSASLVINDHHRNNSEHITLDSLMVQYLRDQHSQCQTPITTLPPLSLSHPHVCREPNRSLDASSNLTSRLAAREFKHMYGRVHGKRRDRQLVYSRFKSSRVCCDYDLLTCIAFLGRYNSCVAVGSETGNPQIIDSVSGLGVEFADCHHHPMTFIQSVVSADSELLLSSCSHNVKLWNCSSFICDDKWKESHSFEGCKAARFSNFGKFFAAMSSDPAKRGILLYDVQTCQLVSTFSDSSITFTGQGHPYSPIHFSPYDAMLLWNGVLWDLRVSEPVQRFNQFTDVGGGGFHPAGNEVILNSEVWDMRQLKMMRCVPSLDNTTIKFNARGDVIYAIVRRNIDDVLSAVHKPQVEHPLYAAFRTIDAVTYSDIATIPVDQCVLDLTTEPTDSFVGLVTTWKNDENEYEEKKSAIRIYEIGNRRPTDDDYYPDDVEDEEEDEDA